jgi:hypothetical protein
MIQLESRYVVLRCEDNGSILLTNSNVSLQVKTNSIEIRSPESRVDIRDNKVDIAGNVYINDKPLPMPVYESSVFKTNTNWTITSDMYINDGVSYPGELFGLLFGRMDAARCLRIISEVFVELRAELSGEVRVRAQTRKNGEKSKTVERRKNHRVSFTHYFNQLGIGNPPSIPLDHIGTEHRPSRSIPP